MRDSGGKKWKSRTNSTLGFKKMCCVYLPPVYLQGRTVLSEIVNENGYSAEKSRENNSGNTEESLVIKW